MLLRNTVLKGMCPEIFYLYFFPDPSLSGPLTNRLEYFLHSFETLLANLKCKSYAGKADEAISLTPQVPSPLK